MTESVIIDLAGRYAAAFGSMAAANAVHKHFILNKKDNEYDVELYADYDNEFEKTKFEYDGKTLEFASMMHGYNSSVFAPPLLMSFSRKKNLIETQVNGSNNVIVERWGTAAWSINIRGVLVDMENKQYPSDKINKLHKFFEFNNIISVSGTQFYEKDIDSIYVKELNIDPVEGFADTIKISLLASSIKEVGYSLINPDAE